MRQVWWMRPWLRRLPLRRLVGLRWLRLRLLHAVGRLPLVLISRALMTAERPGLA